MDENSCLTGLTNLYISFKHQSGKLIAGFEGKITDIPMEYGMYGGLGGYRDFAMFSINHIGRRELNWFIKTVILTFSLGGKQRFVTELLYRMMERDAFNRVLKEYKLKVNKQV
jgi:hypothetical protein